MNVLKHKILKRENFHNDDLDLAHSAKLSVLLTWPKIGPFKFGSGNIGKIGIGMFGMGKGGGKGNIGLNANVIGDANNNVAETYTKTLNVNMLTNFLCTTRNGRVMMTGID